VRFQFSDNPMIDTAIKGCFMYLNKVQIVDKRASGGGGENMFDVVEGGFEVPEAAASDDADF
jgi:hypothetical protein